MADTQTKKRIVVLGCGFGGLEFCKQFESEHAEITVVDRQNHHLFQPLLYQVATAGLSVPDIAQPIRAILNKRPDITVLQDEAVGIDTDARQVALRHRDDPLPYDALIVAVGARTSYFGHDEWEAHAPGLKSLDDATLIRHNVLLAFEEAERTDDPQLRERLMTIAVVGGGPTGIELAGSMAELARCTLKRDFRRADPGRARVILVEALPRILPQFDEEMSESARKQLESLGVEVMTDHMVQDIQEGRIVFKGGEELEAENIIWGAGVAGSPLVEQLPVEVDKANRVPVQPDFSLPGHPDVFVIGDLAKLKDAEGKPVPGVSPAAMQAGKHVAKVLCKEYEAEAARRPKPERPAFVYNDKGQMATIGRSKAVAQVGKARFTGFTAWLAWLFVHLIFLVGLRNKVAVLFNWCYHYLRYRPGARIITGMDRSFRVGNPKARPLFRGEKRPGEFEGADRDAARKDDERRSA